MSHHSHPHALSLDRYAQQSRLASVSPFVKSAFACAVLILCVAANSAAVGLFISICMLTACLLLSRAPARYVLSLLCVPALFLLVGCITLVFDLSTAPQGFWDLPLGSIWISASAAGIQEAGLLFFRAYGAVISLYFLSLTTPVQELLDVLRTLHLPGVMIELMYLVYRYLFLLFDIQHHMAAAAQSRLGGTRPFYTFSHISGNLLAASFRRSSTCFDAMEARCYDGTLRFLSHPAPIQGKHVAVSVLCFLLLAALSALIKYKGVELF